MNIVALLDSMWNWNGLTGWMDEAPRHYRINPDNHSGRRLYRLCGSHNLLVTNSCRYIQQSPHCHGQAEPKWVRENLMFLQSEGMDLLLVCGKVAQKTFLSIDFPQPFEFGVYFMDHPASRRWSNESLKRTAEAIERFAS